MNERTKASHWQSKPNSILVCQGPCIPTGVTCKKVRRRPNDVHHRSDDGELTFLRLVDTMLVLYETSLGFCLFKLSDSARLKEANLWDEFETPEKANNLYATFHATQILEFIDFDYMK